EISATGLRVICGGTEAIVGSGDRRNESIQLWARLGPGEVDLSSWETPLEAISRVLGSETRLLTRAEFAMAGLGFLESRPGEYALSLPLRVSDVTLGVLIAMGDLGDFLDDAVSLAWLFAAHVSAPERDGLHFDQDQA